MLGQVLRSSVSFVFFFSWFFPLYHFCWSFD